MRHIYTSTVCLANTEPVLERIKRYQAYGINAIELGGGVSVDSESLEKLPSLGLNLLLHNYFPPAKDSFYLNLSSPDKIIYQRSIDYILENIQRSGDWGAKLYSFHAGFITDPVGANEKGLIFSTPPATHTETEAAIERFAQSLIPIIQKAILHNVTVAIENNVCRSEHRGRLILQTAEEFLDLFQRVSDPKLGVLIDTGHVDITAQTFNFEAKQFIETLRPFIKAFHISQNDGHTDLALPLDASNPVLQILKTFDVPIVNEAHFEHIDSLATHFHWLKQELEG